MAPLLVHRSIDRYTNNLAQWGINQSRKRCTDPQIRIFYLEKQHRPLNFLNPDTLCMNERLATTAQTNTEESEITFMADVKVISLTYSL